MTSSSAVAPSRVGAGHLEDEPLHLLGGPGPPRAALLAAVMLPCDELAVPTNQCIGDDERCDLAQSTPSDRMSASSKTPSLDIAQPRAPSSERLTEDAVLLVDVLDRLLLGTIHPAGDNQSTGQERRRPSAPTMLESDSRCGQELSFIQ